MLLCKKPRHVLFSTSLIIGSLTSLHEGCCLAEMIKCLGLQDDLVIYALVA